MFGFEVVWVLIDPTGEISLYSTFERAKRSLSPQVALSLQEKARQVWEARVNSAKVWRLFARKINGSAGVR